jgi:hypothetical protein
MTELLTMECAFRIGRSKHGRKRVDRVAEPVAPLVGRIPRVSRLMALAIRMEGLIQCGAVGDYAELARLGHVSRARISQIMNLLLLAPDLQEKLLFLPPIERGRDRLRLRRLLPIALTPAWRRQRQLWRGQIDY